MADSVDARSERRTIAKNVNDIRIEEYRTLRVELDDTVKALRQVELYTIGSVAAVYAWLATHIDVLAPGTLPWWIPLGIAGFGLFKNRALISQLRSLTEYIQNKLEPSIVVEGVHPLKWYEYLRDHYPKIFNWYDRVFWAVLIAITVTTPIFAVLLLHPAARHPVFLLT